MWSGLSKKLLILFGALAVACSEGPSEEECKAECDKQFVLCVDVGKRIADEAKSYAYQLRCVENLLECVPLCRGDS